MGRTSKDLIEEHLDSLGYAIRIAIKNLIAEGVDPDEARELVGTYLQDYECEAEETSVPGEEE